MTRISESPFVPPVTAVTAEGPKSDPVGKPADHVPGSPGPSQPTGSNSNSNIDPPASVTEEAPTAAHHQPSLFLMYPSASQIMEPQTVTTAEPLAKKENVVIAFGHFTCKRGEERSRLGGDGRAREVHPRPDINQRVNDLWGQYPPPMVIGGRQRGLINLRGTPYSQFGTFTHDIIRYISSAAGAVSLALLTVSHFLSLDQALRWTRLSWSPNTWEFGIYATYLQQMASMSQLTLIKSP